MKAAASPGCLFISAPWWPVEAVFLPKPITAGLGACTRGLSQSQTLRAGLLARGWPTLECV